jgi:hypothetical protein
MNTEIKKEDWGKFFDHLSKRRFEWVTEIEVLDPEMGDQTLSNGLPLNGITVESIGDNTSIEISVGETVGHHQSHTIRNPTRVAFLEADAGNCDVVDIEEATGSKTLIRLIEPMGVLIGFSTYEMAVAAAL